MWFSVGFAQSEDIGVVTGTVRNETTGETIPGAEVTISKFADQSGASEDTTTTADDAGVFTFENLDVSDGFAYAVSTRYMGVLYASTMILLSNDSEQGVDIVVFDSTTDQSVISIPTRGLIVSGLDPEIGVLSVTDAYTFEVSGNQTVVEGGDGYSVKFPVPENVEEITPRPGFNFGTARVEETSVLVTTALKPGQTNASLEYDFNYTGTSIEVPIDAAYPTRTFQILIPVSLSDDDISVSAAGVQILDAGLVPINGRDYHVWRADVLPIDSTMTLTIAGLPSPPTVNSLSTLEPAILAGLAVLAAAAITGWVVVSRGLHRPRPVELAPAAAAPLDERREELSADLRALESAWFAGNVPEPEYRSSRKLILEELRSISRQYRGLGDDE